MKKISFSIAFFTLFYLITCNASVLPTIPVPFKSGTGVIDNKKIIYIGLGSAGKSWFKMDLNQDDKQWTPIANFPGVAREQATSVFINGNIYVFGGFGKSQSGLTEVLHDIYKYNPEKNEWSELMSHSPVGLVGHSSFIYNGKAIIMGGVNENIFNGYFEDLANAKDDADLKNKIVSKYFRKPVNDYFYNKQIISFDPETELWGSLGSFPYAGTAGSTIITEKNNKILIVNGEVKPGLRTPTAYEGEMRGDRINWHPVASVANPDGVAGGFGGISHGSAIFAGGASFPGSSKNYVQGHYYAHEGLQKKYSDTVYIFSKNKWIKAGNLPIGIAYGVSIPWHNGLLIIGGETTGGKANPDSMFLQVSKEKLSVDY
ncbi:N-acetylneuraminate epimerase [Rouxiella silvae]|uniref:N-acetylneuraminate epimerase n=1 Tax=Rouxiella silvae TaxID=1646373 RepID=UPI0039F08103